MEKLRMDYHMGHVQNSKKTKTSLKFSETLNFFSFVLNGLGVMNYKNGDQYDGDWKRGKKHGEGLYRYKNGAYYTGR